LEQASKTWTSRESAGFIGKLLLSKKAEEILLLNIAEISSIADYFIICTGSSDTHVRAIAQEVMRGMKKARVMLLHDEGLAHGDWVLLDYIDVVVHIFRKEVRDYYKLEELWGDAPSEIIEERLEGEELKVNVKENV
jgi:ribosome-associated protein